MKPMAIAMGNGKFLQTQYTPNPNSPAECYWRDQQKKYAQTDIRALIQAGRIVLLPEVK
jgi:hypothetical protein